MTHTSFKPFAFADAILAALAEAGFERPTPIQAEAIGPQMEGRDLLGLAETGSGKTAAFVLPILHALAMRKRPRPKTARALILSPTRELAVQIEDTAKALRGSLRLSTLLVLGGTSRAAQVRSAARGVDILVATPGRLNDLIAAGELDLSATEILVLDEADRMLDMGFIKPVRDIVRHLPRERRTALFSATMPADVTHLAESLLTDPVRVEVNPPGRTVGTVAQSVELLGPKEKRQRLAAILSADGVGRSIVFARTKRGADRVAQNLAKDGIPAEAIHGNKSQNARQRALDAFKRGNVSVLVATDIAARGIDVKDITHVVQFDLPDEPEVYVHRIGRTGRNGATGTAIALCGPEERDKLRAVERLTRQRLAPASESEARPSRTATRERRMAERGTGERGTVERRMDGSAGARSETAGRPTEYGGEGRDGPARRRRRRRPKPAAAAVA